MPGAGWGVAVIAALLVATAHRVEAQNGGPDAASRTTMSGVYTAEQAARGADTYAMMCRSCHTPASHTGAVFANSWDRKPLSELYRFLTQRMPKNEPGSLAPEEYAQVLAYLLKMNDMPAGSDELPADSVALEKIRIDAGRKNP